MRFCSAGHQQRSRSHAHCFAYQQARMFDVYTPGQCVNVRLSVCMFFSSSEAEEKLFEKMQHSKFTRKQRKEAVIFIWAWYASAQRRSNFAVWSSLFTVSSGTAIAHGRCRPCKCLGRVTDGCSFKWSDPAFPSTSSRVLCS